MHITFTCCIANTMYFLHQFPALSTLDLVTYRYLEQSIWGVLEWHFKQRFMNKSSITTSYSYFQTPIVSFSE